MEFLKPSFPTAFHAEAAKIVYDFFVQFPVDTVLIVNSCARGQSTAESDLDIAILIESDCSIKQQKSLTREWLAFVNENHMLNDYKKASLFAHLHVDIINGNYKPAIIQNAEPIDFFEVEIGNQLCYSAPMNTPGDYYKYLRKKWLPFYDENLRTERLNRLKEACHYNFEQIKVLVKRELYFHAFDILYQTLQKYLQTLFIANKIYPIAYNKWINYQLTQLLKKREEYTLLASVLSLESLTGREILKKTGILECLLKNLSSTSKINLVFTVTVKIWLVFTISLLPLFLLLIIKHALIKG